MTTTHEERMAFADEVFNRCKEIMDTKGRSYGGDADATSNFKEIAATTRQTKYQVWQVYAGKHWIAINKSITRDPECPQVAECEPIEERIYDEINYLLLLALMIKEDKGLMQKEDAECEITPAGREFIGKLAMEEAYMRIKESPCRFPPPITTHGFPPEDNA